MKMQIFAQNVNVKNHQFYATFVRIHLFDFFQAIDSKMEIAENAF